MKHSALILSAALAAAGFAPVAFAQDAAPVVSQETPPTATVPAAPAQLKREHDRAVKAGDTANDPFDSSSSDSLNQQQLQAAQGASPIVMPPDEPMPGNATVEAVPDDSQEPGQQPGTPDTVPPMPSQDTPDSVPPAPDVSPPTTDDPLKPASPIQPQGN